MSEVRETSIAMALWHKLKRYWNRRRWETEKRKFENVSVESTVLTVVTNGELVGGDKVCIYASFDSDGVIQPYVLEQLAYYRNHDFKIIFVSTSSTLSEQDLTILKPLCVRVIHRKNYGHDFCSWKVGLNHVLSGIAVDQLLLANDSVFGPFNDFLKNVRAEDNQIIGVTDSFEISYHLQSYWVLLGTRVAGSAEFRSFVDSISVLYEKEKVVTTYEIGLTAALKDRFAITALFPYKECFLRYSQLESYEFKDYNRKLVNPTEFFWDLLLTDGFPFIKRSFLTKNFPKSQKINTWFLLVKSDKHRDMISDYIRKKRLQVLY